MQIYMVGGAVRDALLGLPVQDHDWVVVGATPEDLTAQGFVAVGKDFPVFLHPHTREEYALARTERKTAPGYHGFVVHAEPGVTLEQDLARRDLTINSIAAPAHSTKAGAVSEPDLSALIDPYDGQQDLQRKVLRHVTEAFREDPVRILRLARFAARFSDFSVAPETLALMQDMVASGEADALAPERVWQELARGLMERKPSRMFDVLRDCGALQKLLPEIKWESDPHSSLDLAAQLQAPLPVRFACLGTKLAKLGSDSNYSLLNGLCKRLRVPTECREMADVVAREHGNVHRSGDFSAAAVVRLLEHCDAFRKPGRFAGILLACECDARGRRGLENTPYPQRQRLLQALAAAQSVATAQVAADAQAAGQSGQQIGQSIHQARVAAVGQCPGFAAR